MGQNPEKYTVRQISDLCHIPLKMSINDKIHFCHSITIQWGHSPLSIRTQAGLNQKTIKGTLPRKPMWALNVKFSEKTTMVPFIWM